MRFLFAVLLALTSVASADQATFVRALDLNVPTESADTDQVIGSRNLTTDTTFPLTAQPDVPRNITITVTDTTPSITEGTITVTCLDVNGDTFTEVLNLAGPTLTFTGTKVCASVVSVISAGVATLGGAGDETFIVGTGSVVAHLYCSTSEPLRGAGSIRTSGSSTTVIAAGTERAPFGPLDIGDEIIVNQSGTFTRRVITAKASNTEVTVDSAVNWSGNGTSGFPFTYRDRVCGYADSSGWQDAAGMSQKLIILEIIALSATGGVDYSVECKGLADADTPMRLLAGNLTAAVIPGDPSTTVDPIVVPEVCAALRVGMKYGTTDTSGTDSVSAYLRGEK